MFSGARARLPALAPYGFAFERDAVTVAVEALLDDPAPFLAPPEDAVVTAETSPVDAGERTRIVMAALNAFKAGRFSEAVTIFRDLLQVCPDDAEALHLCGLALDAGGDASGAACAITEALRLGETAARCSDLGRVLGRMGRHAEALVNHERALVLEPDHPATLNNLGNSFLSLKRPHDAVESYSRAVALRPDFAEAWTNLGYALRSLDRDADALEAYEAAVEADPMTEPQGRCDALLALGRFEAAAAVSRRAVERRPADPVAYTDLHNALRALGDGAGAEAAARRALELRPGHVPTYNNLAIVLQERGKLDQALDLLDLAAARDPRDPETQHNRAFVLFLQGRWTEAWAVYDWRLQIRQAGGRHDAFAASTPWCGEPVEGRTVFVVAEQGLGDMIQFVRFVPLLAERGARVVLSIHPPLRRLFEGVPGIECLVPAGHRPQHDVHCPMLSLPRAFGTTPDTVPATVPYLRVDPALASAWQVRLDTGGAGLKVGVVWAGNPKHLNDRRRSIRFDALASLWSVPGIRWFSLQVGPRAADLAAAPVPVEDLSPALGDFADTAAAITALDLVVAVDTSVAHLAGALGKAVWVLLPAEVDWRWGTTGATTPWYPTMRLFRRPQNEGWPLTVAAVAAALRTSVDRVAPDRASVDDGFRPAG